MNETSLPRILITPGEPAGIGPDVTLLLAQKSWPLQLVVIADPQLLKERATEIGLPIKIIEWDEDMRAIPQQAGEIYVYPVALKTRVQTGQLNPANAQYVLETLEKAAFLCVKQKADAVVTGPVHKGVINQAGIPFTGHTEFFAVYCEVAYTLMLFVVNELKVALATTHLALSKVSQTITKERLRAVISILRNGLVQTFAVNSPRIMVCGLNPHAGEGGYLGREEIEVITPVLNEFRDEGVQIEGPFPADTIFTPPYLARADAILAMYHDQALPLVKYLGFGHAVNVTLGLPFIRTSVDHGTALDIAGTQAVNASSMESALLLAARLCGAR